MFPIWEQDIILIFWNGAIFFAMKIVTSIPILAPLGFIYSNKYRGLGFEDFALDFF
jgi:hypothetical protein